jgi:hypothetical protein
MAASTSGVDNTCKVFKCHPQSKVPKIVICLICENVYHEADFNKYTSGQYVSEMFVICPKHRLDNLTSKSDYDLNLLDTNARKIITQIKLFEKEELRNELCTSLSLNNSKNTSDVSETSEVDDLTTIKLENELLKQLNAELQARNKLLDSLVNKDSNNNKCNYSYANVTKAEQVVKRIPKILVRALKDNEHETFNKVKNKITTDTAIPINDIKKKMLMVWFLSAVEITTMSPEPNQF